MRTRTAFCVLSAALLATTAQAEGLNGSIEIAGRGTGPDNNLNRAAEYRVSEGGAELRIDLEAAFEQVYLALTSDAIHADDQKHSLDFELGRTVRSHTTFTRLPHRLEHDPLNNLRGSIKEVVATWSTDLEPDARYDIRYDVFENKTDLQFAGARWLTLSANFRQQWREGHRQSLAVSHCSTCHVQSQGRAVDESTRDAGLTARATFGGWKIEGSYMERDFSERGATPTRTYELTEHPNLRTPVFNDRVQYDSRDGALPYDWVPASEKETAKLDIANGNLSGFALSITGITSTVENKHTDNKLTYDGMGFTLGRKVGKKGRFAFRGRAYSIGTTDYFVDTEEPAAVAGPYKGKTYREQYGYNPDFLRRSAADRDVLELYARYTQRLGKKSSLTASYDIREIDRESYQVAPGKTDTLQQKVRLTYSTRAAKGLRFRAAVTFGDAKHPFMILDGACNPDELQITPAPSPMAPGSTQYYQIHAARAADLTASPAAYKEVRLNGSYQLTTNSVVTLMYRWWDGENKDLDYTDWSRNINAVTGVLALAPAEDWQLFFAATYGKRTMETHVCIPLMDG